MPVIQNRLRWLFPLLGLGAGIIGITLGCSNLFESIRCKSWPQTDGIIRTTKIERLGGRKNRYSVVLFYDYRVDGNSYIGTRLAFGMSVGTKEQAQNFVSRYPAGKNVPVFYSPTNPAESVLEPGVFDGTWTQLGVGSLFLAIGGVLWIAQKKSRAI